MAQILTVIVVLGLIALVVARVRAKRLHFRIADWPLGQQIETGIAALFAILALLGLIAGEYGFSSWLALMAALVASFAILTWPPEN